MIFQDLGQAIKILDTHKFGAKTKSGIERARASAAAFSNIVRQLPEDLGNVLKNLWLIERALVTDKNLTKEQKTGLRSKRKQLRDYIEDSIKSIVYP